MITIDYAMNVATQLQNQGNLAQANMILNSILDLNPNYAYALHLSGIIAYQTGEATAGIQLIHQAIENHPTEALFHSNLGEMYRQLKNIRLSIQYGRQAVALDPNSAVALSNLGIAYYDEKNYEQAENCHKGALAMNPKLGCSLNNMGSIYKSLGKMQEAIAYYQEAIAVEPTFIEPLTNLATLFLEQHAFKQAVECSQQAIQLAPTSSEAYCNMGLALLGLDQYNSALLHFGKALQLKANYADAYYGIAKIYLCKNNFTESENHIQKALIINPKQAEYYQLLADIYHQQGNHTAALIQLDHALSIYPELASSYLSKGNILMEIGEIAHAEEQFLKITQDSAIDTRLLANYCLVQLRKTELNNPYLKTLLTILDKIHEVSPHKQEYIYFALGKCYDDMGEEKKAFSYYTRGCHLKRKRITYDMVDQIHLTHNIINIFTKSTIDYLRTFANSSDLPIFIVGMPRSGTTLVEQIIANHGNVYGAGELTYLNDLIQHPAGINHTLYYPENIPHLTPDIYHSITKKYLGYLQQFSSDAIRIIDKMPQNFTAIGLIHALFPNAKIIHVKRNPIDTCLSCYTKLFTKGQDYSYDLTELGQYYNCYEMMMNHWRSILPTHAWLDIHYEDIIQQTEIEAKRLIAYCDLPWDPACLTFYESKRTVRTASFIQVRQPVYTSSLNRWRRFENELAPLLAILNQSGVQSVAQQQV